MELAEWRGEAPCLQLLAAQVPVQVHRPAACELFQMAWQAGGQTGLPLGPELPHDIRPCSSYIRTRKSTQVTACALLQELKRRGLLASGESILIVQSSDSSAWGFECNHAIMLYAVP